MHSQTVETFLKEITGPIDLSTLVKFGGGGFHDIYKSNKYPGILFKVMRNTVGKDKAELSKQALQLEEQYSALYEIFSPSRCIVERFSVQEIKDGNSDKPKQAIISIVPYDTCFESKEKKLGFNVCTAELDGRLLNSKRYLYGMANLSLLGDQKTTSPYVMRNYPLLNETFATIFKLLDTNKSFVEAMREFLTKYKLFYQKTGILLDTVGLENVLFYKVNNVWQFKLGSVIKQNTGALTKQMLAEIKKTPAIVHKSIEIYTSIYFMPACIRALNACAEKIGLGKIIDDVIIDAETIDILAKMHMQLGKPFQIRNFVEHGEFSTALKLYNQYTPDEKSDDTKLRDLMGISYWNFIEKGGKEANRDEVESYLKILKVKRKEFPDIIPPIVSNAIAGLQKKLDSLGEKKKTEVDHKQSSKTKLFDHRTKAVGESDKQFVARLGRQKARPNKF